MTYYKFLSYNLASSYDQAPKVFYPSPTWDGKKWTPGKWVEQKDAPADGRPCAPGLHLSKDLRPRYGRFTGNVYEAEGDQLLGEDEDKARFKRVRLVRPVEFKEIFHPKAHLSGAFLSGAFLSGADLSGADLSGANLRSANLRSADLSGADLRSADLSGADLSGADLRSANLRSADLRSANLRSADLSGADLSGADLSGADLSGADLSGADLSGSHGLKAHFDTLEDGTKKTIYGVPHC